MRTIAISLLLAAAAAAQAPSYRIHEWGTFTTITKGDGSMMRWQPLAGASELPRFVHDIKSRSKGDIEGTVRMETPVIYFHSDRPFEVDVEVGFRGGMITEWYPTAKLQNRRRIGGIRWHQVLVGPTRLQPLRGKKHNHYYEARNVAAQPVRVRTAKGTEAERFLFYRGVGSFALPIDVRYDAGKVRVTSKHDDAIVFVVFEHKGGRVGHSLHTLDGREGTPLIPRPLATPAARSDHEKTLERLLISTGLYRDEARAMVRTWRSTWFGPGLRVFWIVPQAFTDKVLPLRMRPPPAEAVRVLVGQVEILTPETDRRRFRRTRARSSARQ